MWCNFRRAWAIIGISAGLMAAAVFGPEYHNWVAMSLALLSSCFAAQLLWLHLAYDKGRLDAWLPRTFRLFVVINGLLCAIALSGMVVSLVLAGVRHHTLSHEGLQGNNLWIVAVWAWMCSKWTMMSAIFARRYSKLVRVPLLANG